MTDRELKLYAISGLLVRIKAEENKYKEATSNSKKIEIQLQIDILKKHYTELLNDIAETDTKQ